RILPAVPDASRERDLGWRFEAEALEEGGVGDEAQELREVGGAAGAPVGRRLGDHAGGHGGEPGELGVELRLTAEGEERDAVAETRLAELVEGFAPGAAALVEADEHGPHAVERGRGRVGGEVDTAVAAHGREVVG